MLIAAAAIAMVFDDVLAVCLVQAEARDRAVLSGALDSIMWLFSMVVTVTTVDVMQGHHTSVKVLAVGAITLANFTGSMAGVQIGKRLIKTRSIVTPLAPILHATPADPSTVTEPTGIERGLRTAVAAGVGFGVAELARAGLHLPAGDEANVTALLTAAAGAGYNALALWAEKRWSWARALLLWIGN